MPYIEYVIKLEYCPDLGKYSDGLTTNEWKALCEYAKQYNISVRPIVNLLGHFDKNSTIKELQKITIKNKDNNYTSVIDPLNPEVRPLINKILDEVVYAFGESIIHVGGDEPCKLSEVYGKEKAYLLIEEMDKALSFMKSLTLKYNIDAFEALILGAKRIKFTAEKLTYLPQENIGNRDDAMTYIDKTLYLAEEIEKVRKYHQYIWFKTNRLSDWGYVDTLYQDLRDQLTHLLED